MSHRYYFFSLAYTNIPVILAIIEKINFKNPNINIVLHTKFHRKFWQELIENNKLNWKVLFLNVPHYSFKNIFSWIKIRQLIRRLFKMNFGSLHNSYIYFFSSSSSVVMFSLIKLLAARNRIFFIDCDKRVFPKWQNLRNIIYKFLVYLIYRVEARIVNVGDRPMSILSERFFEKAKVERVGELKEFYDHRILRRYNFVSNSIAAGKRIVLLDDDYCAYESISSREAHKILNTLKKIIDTNFSKNEVLFKRHPNPLFHTKNFSSIYDDYIEYPCYIPSDFIFLEPNIRFVIGGASTTLPIASKYYNVKSISYIKLAPCHNDKFKNLLIRILKAESDDKIEFPESWDEMISLLRKN